MKILKVKTVIALWVVMAAVIANAAKVEVIKIPSIKMGKEIPATLILPDSYGKDKLQRFPVLYLLHGAGGNYTSWNAKTEVAKLADQYGIIVLCPDAGRTSWYFDSPIDSEYQYESYVAEDCVRFVDKHYLTNADRGHRALCGNSMGGHGALFLAIRHRDVFGIAVPLSGGVDLRPFPNNWNIKKRIGTIDAHPENWKKYSVVTLAKTLKPNELAISIDCGDKDFFLKVNRALHTQLTDAGIAHNYIEKPGAHNWIYWQEAIKRQMLFIANEFEKNSTCCLVTRAYPKRGL